MPEVKIARHTERIEEYRMEYNSLETPGAGYSFPCDELGNIDAPMFEPRWWSLINVTYMQSDKYEGPFMHDYSRDVVHDTVYLCERCRGDAEFSRYCGAVVCNDCNTHQGMARCYCGWSVSGRSGYQELIEMGETIEEEW